MSNAGASESIYLPLLIAVAPGRNIFRVVATITGETRRPDPNVARPGFEGASCPGGAEPLARGSAHRCEIPVVLLTSARSPAQDGLRSRDGHRGRACRDSACRTSTWQPDVGVETLKRLIRRV